MTKEAGEGFSRQVTLENIDSFGSLLKRTAESPESEDEVSEQEEAKPAAVAKPVDPEFVAAEALFEGNSIKYKSTFKRTSVKGSSKAKAKKKSIAVHLPLFGTAQPAQPAQAAIHSAAQEIKAKGRLVWQKELTATDAQRVKGRPTKEIRLVQAKWEETGYPINH